MTTSTFEGLGLSKTTLEALTKKGFTQPTLIQSSVIPMLLDGAQNIIGNAQTGTGKTAAFGLPIIDTLVPNTGHIQALIVTPTRELALQVTSELMDYKGKKELKVVTIYGGQSIEGQRTQLKRGCDIVVGTPGRLIDHMRGKLLDLSHVQFVVLDEADEMLNGGFIEDIELILKKTNENRKTLLFSATMSDSVMAFANATMPGYQVVKAKANTVATELTTQLFYELNESDKLNALCRIMDVETDFYGFVFCRTKRDVDTICEKLIQRGYPAEALHGDLSQAQRERVLTKFRQKNCRLLVVTDVASRGIDIGGLTHVINYALPDDAEAYVHRIGRTGRAGQKGTAISLVAPSEFRKIKMIQRVSGTEIKKSQIPTVEAIMASKKNQLQSDIMTHIKKGLSQDVVAFASRLLDHHTPQDVLAGILAHAFNQEFSASKYPDIREPIFQPKSNSHRDRGRGRSGNGSHRRSEGRFGRRSENRSENRSGGGLSWGRNGQGATRTAVGKPRGNR